MVQFSLIYKKGEDSRYCLNCYKEEITYLDIDKNAHDWGIWHTDAYATALKSGKEYKECWECHLIETKVSPKLKAIIKLSATKKKIKKKSSFYLSIKRYTYGDDVKKYTTSNKKIATVTKSGRVTGKKKGTTYITVKMKSGISAKCKVIVK